jgi:hypothetical protein
VFLLLVCAAPAHAYTADQESACRGDAFRLCASAIPNVGRITLCMINKLDQLSPRCRAFFKTESDLKSEQAARSR